MLSAVSHREQDGFADALIQALESGDVQGRDAGDFLAQSELLSEGGNMVLSLAETEAEASALEAMMMALDEDEQSLVADSLAQLF